jgi:putative SOS response-associated peptidase YedK
MQVDEAPEDDEIRETYNFAPSSYGAVYRADSPDHGPSHDDHGGEIASQGEPDNDVENGGTQNGDEKAIKYKLQKMRWGLIPFWTKRQPDYRSMMRTINCRDDSLIENRGMWTSMKRRKRCIVICQGFYEWLKKGPGGKEKIPHFVKRKDGDLMCFAGLWDSVKYEGRYHPDSICFFAQLLISVTSDAEEKLYTYTIITTSSNTYLNFLHDRMPVILEPGSEAMMKWLDPHRTDWTPELQSLLQPYSGELECYPVAKEVGKVGNNSPDFIVPINSKENKANIANFFANAKKKTAPNVETDQPKVKQETKVVTTKSEVRETEDHEWSENNAPMPVPKDIDSVTTLKRERSPNGDDSSSPKVSKVVKTEGSSSPNAQRKIQDFSSSPTKSMSQMQGRKMRSATSNNTPAKKFGNAKKASDGSQRITNFFK